MHISQVSLGRVGTAISRVIVDLIAAATDLFLNFLGVRMPVPKTTPSITQCSQVKPGTSGSSADRHSGNGPAEISLESYCPI